MGRITIVKNDCGDWMGVYKDDVLVYQGHSIEPSRLLEVLGVRHTVIWDYAIPEDEGDLPYDRADLNGSGELNDR